MTLLLCGLRESLSAGTTATVLGLTFLLSVGAGPAAALDTVALGSSGLTASDLAAALAGPGVTVSNVTFSGQSAQAARFSGDTQLGFGTGAVLGTGNAAARGPNSSTASSVNHGGAGDAGLAAGNVDAAVLEFDFVSSTPSVGMRWLFASDEFPATTPRDAFAIWINGTQVSQISAASATPAAINAYFTSENWSARHYLRDNDRTTVNCGASLAACRFDLEADGVSVAFGIPATAVTAGATNHIKIAVADTTDGTVDSWLYLEAGSLRAFESCGNGSDDDSDGRPDATDPDCTTMSVTPIGTGGVTAQALVDNLAGAGVGTSSVTFSGLSAQAGLFSNDVVLGLGSGIILSTGDVASAAGMNDGDKTGQILNVNSGNSEYDRAILGFTFVPTTSRVIFRYVFGSEEYDEYASTQYNDRFSLKVNGVNRALLPDGTTAITINNINGGNTNPADSTSAAAKPALNPAFFRGNDNCGRPGGCPYNTEFDGMTTVLTAEAAVTPNVANTLSIEIADVADGGLNSWIALQADSLLAVEVCANAVDDDGDTLIDSADPDCNVCGDGLTRGAETCDDGNTASGDCCSASCQFEEQGSTCGSASATECNQADTCDGAGICQSNLRSAGFACTSDGNVCTQDICDSLGSCSHATAASFGALCRAAAGACDVAETCDGVGTSCPADAFAGAGTSCRVAAGACDVAETCDGSSSACPADALASSGTECRGSTGACDVAETCTGSASACPADALASSGTSCRVAAGACDVAETCDGSSSACPADALASSGTSCRLAAGACDVAETCTGSASACPADALASSGTECRASADACDVVETCSGSSSACPADALASSGTECRASTGACDVAETCDGSASACPADVLASSGTECRGSADACDVAETCTGSASVCPTDALASSGTSCRVAAGACDIAETCDGSSSACPADAVASSGTECRASADACDVAETCSGSASACPADALASSGTSCRVAAGACDIAETCDGSSSACPTDVLASSGTSCRVAAGDCDAAESCDGTSAACPADVLASLGTVCRVAAGDCDAAESCDGGSAACPADVVAVAGTTCRAPAGGCDVVESCDGAGATCPADVLADAGIECRTAVDNCDLSETCDGLAAACPVDEIIVDFETCDDGDALTDFEYCEAGVCGNGIVPIDLVKLFVWPTADHGSIVKAKASFVDSFVFDLSDGVTVRIRDGAGQASSLVFYPSECALLPGQRVLCSRENASGLLSDRIRVSSRRGGINRMDLYLNSLDLDVPLVSPVTLDMELKGRRFGSQAVNCSGGAPPAIRMTCTP